jgi:hypothetical protein
MGFLKWLGISDRKDFGDENRQDQLSEKEREELKRRLEYLQTQVEVIKRDFTANGQI